MYHMCIITQAYVEKDLSKWISYKLIIGGLLPSKKTNLKRKASKIAISLGITLLVDQVMRMTLVDDLQRISIKI